MPGMRDVARVAEVSLSTVSAVLSDSEKYVSDEIKNKVLDAAQKLGYQMPRRRKKQEKAIAVILPVITSAFFSNLLSGIESTASEHGYTLLYGDSSFDFDKERKYINALQKQSLYGMIIDTTCPSQHEATYFRQLKQTFVERGIPVAFLERKIPDDAFFSVYVDHEDNAYQATRHLLSLGRKAIAHISGSKENPLAIERNNGFIKALGEYGIKMDPDLQGFGDWTPNSGFIAAKSILSKRRDFTGLVADNDQMAIGAIKAILSEGISIPDDIAITGIDNLSVSTMITPSLTTVNVPTYQMGRTAARMVLEAKKNNSPFQEKLNCNLIVRKSTNPYASNEWELFGW